MVKQDKELYEALLSAQKELSKAEIKLKGKVNFGKTKFDYCTLTDLLKTVVPALNNNNIYMEHSFAIIDDKEVLVLLLTHTPSGQSTQSIVYYSGDGKDDKIWGGGITYRRRYMTMSKLGIFPDDDNSELPEDIFISDEQLRELHVQLHENDNDEHEFEKALIKRYEALKKMPKTHFKQLMQKLKGMRDT